MLIWENITLAISSLLSNKMRALLTMLGIIIGIAAVIAIVTVGDSLTISVSENMKTMGANDVYAIIQPRDADEDKNSKLIDGVVYGTIDNSSLISEDDYITSEMITDLCEEFKDEIHHVTISDTLGNSIVSVNNNEAKVTVQGANVGYYVSNEKTILAGRFFSQEEFEDGNKVALVSDKFVNKLFDGNFAKALGQEVEIVIDTNIAKFTIVGIYEQQDNYMMGMSMAGSDAATDFYIPLKAVKQITHEDSKFQYVQIVANVGVDSDVLAKKVENFFELYYRNNKTVTITAFTMGSMIDIMGDMLGTITVAITVVAGIALVVGGIGVMNIMLVSVTERTREIGTRKALGAKNSSIRTQFIIEAMIICLIGGAIGVAVGIVGGIIASNYLGYPAIPSIPGIIVSLVFSMSIGIFFGYYPANKAAKMNPIDALRYE